jgi:AcrR family transcriptional regulator
MSSLNSLTYDDLGSAAQRERRKRILDAAIALASKGGFEQMQMRAVAERADVALGTLYRYFPSKIHLLVSALAAQFEQARETFDRKPIPGDTPADRVMYVLGRTTRTLQRDPNLTEALTRAFMFADASVANEIHVVGMHVTRMLMAAMRDPSDVLSAVEPPEPTDEEIAITKVIGDVWLASLVQWVTGRASANDVAKSMDVAVHLLLR